jgi:hypothetical protein
MDKEPLVIEQKDAGRQFLAEFQKYYPVRAAFWLRESDATEWDLYVASDQITDDNLDVAYGEAVTAAGAVPNPSFDLFRVKLIGVDDPLAKAAIELHRNYPGPIATHFGGRAFGGVSVDGVYLYPAPLPVSA